MKVKTLVYEISSLYPEVTIPALVFYLLFWYFEPRKLREAFKKKINKKCGFNPQGGGFGPNPHFLKSVDLGGVFLLFLHIFALFGPSWTILVR